MFVVHHIVSGEDAFARHSELRKVIGVQPTTDESCGIQADDSLFYPFFPPNPRLILRGGFRHRNRRSLGLCTPAERNERTGIGPSWNRDNGRSIFSKRAPDAMLDFADRCIAAVAILEKRSPR